MTHKPRAPSIESFTTDDNDVTFLIVSAAGIAYDHTIDRIEQIIERGRRVNVIATPTAASWFRASGINHTIKDLTGWAMRCEQRMPWEPTFDPPASEVIASPVTLNTLTLWAAGHGPNLAVSLLNEASGTPGLPVRAELSLSWAYADHEATCEALARLQRMNVDVVRSPYGGAKLPTSERLR